MFVLNTQALVIFKSFLDARSYSKNERSAIDEFVNALNEKMPKQLRGILFPLMENPESIVPFADIYHKKISALKKKSIAEWRKVVQDEMKMLKTVGEA